MTQYKMYIRNEGRNGILENIFIQRDTITRCRFIFHARVSLQNYFIYGTKDEDVR